MIIPETDLEHYGVPDYWSLPTDGKGDCEDYALLKRHKLIMLGWPSAALLMTVVRDTKGEGHAVLTARTTGGDFILDNKSNEVRLWNQTSYEFLMRQSYLNPRAWIALDPTRDLYRRRSPASARKIDTERNAGACRSLPSSLVIADQLFWTDRAATNQFGEALI